MRDRIATQVSSDAGALSVTTFHAFCARILRSEAQYIGLSQTLLSTIPQKVRPLLNKFSLDMEYLLKS